MIIFGWGRQTIKNYGITFKNHCSNCNNEDYWQLLKITTWFTLFFIPIIPYEVKYFLRCPVCEKGVYIEHDKIQDLKNLAEANTDLVNKRITIEEYNNRLGGQNEKIKDEAKYIEGEIEKGESILDNTDNIIFCEHCGQKNINSHNFCQNCGEKIN